jgi:pSer/pThr/pTyr-binding forkhead associated (FHA) protein
MRIGSLEMLGALLAFAAVTARLRTDWAAPRANTVHLELALQEVAAARSAPRALSVTLSEGTPCIIGRSQDADIAVTDPEVSRRHARIDVVRGVLYLADLGSSNGTFLNGKPLGGDGIELRPGDDIDVGNTRITVSGTALA